MWRWHTALESAELLYRHIIVRRGQEFEFEFWLHHLIVTLGLLGK